MPNIMFITTPDNWAQLQRENIWPIKDMYRRSALSIKAGDEIVVYVSRISSFVAIIKITEELFTPSRQILFNGDFYEHFYRFKLKVLLEEDKVVPIKNILEDLVLTKNKIRWGNALQKALLNITEQDYRFIHNQIMLKVPKS